MELEPTEFDRRTSASVASVGMESGLSGRGVDSSGAPVGFGNGTADSRSPGGIGVATAIVGVLSEVFCDNSATEPESAFVGGR